MIDSPLTVARAVHFAAVLLVQGCIVVRFLVAGRGLTAEIRGDRFSQHLFHVEAGGWLVAVSSGAAWLLLLAAEVDDASVSEALRDGTAWTLLTQTQFGWAWVARAVGFVLLAIVLPMANRNSATGLSAIVLSLALSGSLAWSGHGAATLGAVGDLHLAADILHLLASGVWLGGLLPFAILLTTRPEAAAETTRRFASLATLSVLILVPSGVINGWMIVGSVAALTGTLYGELLLAKIALFLLMLAFAGVNRFVLTSQLAIANLSIRARERLVIHSGCEIALGLAILVIVGVLGTLTPMEEHGQHHKQAATVHSNAGPPARIQAKAPR